MGSFRLTKEASLDVLRFDEFRKRLSLMVLNFSIQLSVWRFCFGLNLPFIECTYAEAHTILVEKTVVCPTDAEGTKTVESVLEGADRPKKGKQRIIYYITLSFSDRRHLSMYRLDQGRLPHSLRIVALECPPARLLDVTPHIVALPCLQRLTDPVSLSGLGLLPELRVHLKCLRELSLMQSRCCLHTASFSRFESGWVARTYL